jgi:hypothetical protein
LFPLLSRNARFTQDLSQEAEADVSAMWVRNSHARLAADHELVPSARKWSLEAKLSQPVNQLAARDRSQCGHSSHLFPRPSPTRVDVQAINDGHADLVVKTDENPILQHRTQFLAALAQGPRICPESLEPRDGRELTVLVADVLVLGLSHRGLDVFRQHGVDYILCTYRSACESCTSLLA